MVLVTGKTQLLQTLIDLDIELASESPIGFAIIDSQGDLIRLVSQQQAFNPDGGALANHIIIIDPADIEYPPALNMFDLNLYEANTLGPADREAIRNAALDTYRYMFSGLFGSTLTGRQNMLFTYIATVLMEIPGATIFTLRDFIEDPTPFTPYIEKLSGTARTFFERQFSNKTYDEVRQQLLTRIYTVLANPVFDRMFR